MHIICPAILLIPIQTPEQAAWGGVGIIWHHPWRDLKDVGMWHLGHGVVGFSNLNDSVIQTFVECRAL